MNKKTAVILTIILAFTLIPLIVSANDLVLVAVHNSIYNDITNSLNIYEEDLIKQGYNVEIYICNSCNSSQLKNVLIDRYNNQNLVGAIFVGKIPIHLDGSYPDESYYSSDGLSIWTGRIKSDLLTYHNVNEIDLINNYFRKNHQYRIMNLTLPHRGIGYGGGFPIPSIYNNERVITDLYTSDGGNIEEYYYLIEQGYEWMCAGSHGSNQLYDFYDADGPDYFWSIEIKGIDPKVFFYNLHGCYNGKFTMKDNIGTWHIFSDTYTILAIAQVDDTGGLGPDYRFWDAVNELKVIGAAFKSGGMSSSKQVIFGDPTLMPVLQDITPINITYKEKIGKLPILNATISNIGDTNLTNITVSFYNNNTNTLIDSTTISNLNINQTKTASINFKTTPDTYNIYIVTDENNSIIEINEINNIKSKTFTIIQDTDKDGIADENDIDDDNDGVLDTEDNLIGNLSFVVTDISNLNITIDNSTNLTTFNKNKLIEFKQDKPILKFNWNFSNKLNLGNITLNKQTNENYGYLIVKGINLINKTKTIYIDDISESNKVCIKDQEISLISEISEMCDQDNEFLIECNNTIQNDYTCTSLGNYYKITGLKHSGIKEMLPYCGDGNCNNNEDCSSCSIDCGTCSSGGSGGSSGGGGRSYEENEEPIWESPEINTPIILEQIKETKEEKSQEAPLFTGEVTKEINKGFITYIIFIIITLLIISWFIFKKK